MLITDQGLCIRDWKAKVATRKGKIRIHYRWSSQVLVITYPLAFTLKLTTAGRCLFIKLHAGYLSDVLFPVERWLRGTNDA